MRRPLAALALVPLFGLGLPAGAEEPAWLSALGAEGRDRIQTVRAEARVTVSDGLQYDVVTLFHDHQRAIFHRSYPDRKVTVGVEGKYVWQYDGSSEAEAPAFFEDIVLGHQFHAQLLFFDTLNGPLEAPVEEPCGQARCLSYAGARRTLRVEAETRRPVGLTFSRDDGPPIEIGFDRWQEKGGVDLPFLVTIDDGERVFDYAFRSIAFNQGSLGEFRAPEALLTEEQKLLRLHRLAMDAHFFEDAEMLKGHFGPEGVVASAGEVYEVTGADTEAMMQRIFSNRDHSRYDDLVRPIVRVSDDGTLGWVVARVEAEGVRLDESGAETGPLAFTCAWISLYEKRDGRWRHVGNVSNFLPE